MPNSTMKLSNILLIVLAIIGTFGLVGIGFGIKTWSKEGLDLVVKILLPVAFIITVSSGVGMGLVVWKKKEMDKKG